MKSWVFISNMGKKKKKNEKLFTEIPFKANVVFCSSCVGKDWKVLSVPKIPSPALCR